MFFKSHAIVLKMGGDTRQSKVISRISLIINLLNLIKHAVNDKLVVISFLLLEVTQIPFSHEYLKSSVFNKTLVFLLYIFLNHIYLFIFRCSLNFVVLLLV